MKVTEEDFLLWCGGGSKEKSGKLKKVKKSRKRVKRRSKKSGKKANTFFFLSSSFRPFVSFSFILRFRPVPIFRNRTTKPNRFKPVRLNSLTSLQKRRRLFEKIKENSQLVLFSTKRTKKRKKICPPGLGGSGLRC